MKRLLLLLVAVAALVGFAAAYLPSDAGSVNGTTVSQSELNADLSAIAGSSGFQCYLYADQVLTGGTAATMFPVRGVGASGGTPTGTATKDPSSVNAGFSRYWLTQLLTNQVVVQVLDQLHLTVTPADLAFGRTSLSAQIDQVLGAYKSQTGSGCGTISAAAVLASLPADFRAEQVRVQADQDVLLAHEAGYTLDQAGLLRYFTLHRATFDTVCLSYAAYGTQAQAAAARAAVSAGTAFGTVGSVRQAGCLLRLTLGQLPSSVTSLGAGQVSPPVATPSGGGYFLFEVTKIGHSTFVVARPRVLLAVLQAGSARASALIRSAERHAVVTADPRYGRVVPRTAALLPPASPPAASVLNPSANLPALTVGGGSGSSAAG